MMEKHNYGLDEQVQQTTLSGSSIRVEKPFKEVILVNVSDCENRITVQHVKNRLQGAGWTEWENILANWLVKAIVDAVKEGSKEADITKLFTSELYGEDKFGSVTKTQENVISFIMGRLFECIEENKEVMRVRIIDRAISSSKN